MDIQDMCDELSDNCQSERWLCKGCGKIWYDREEMEGLIDNNGNCKNCEKEVVRQVPVGIKVEWGNTEW